MMFSFGEFYRLGAGPDPGVAFGGPEIAALGRLAHRFPVVPGFGVGAGGLGVRGPGGLGGREAFLRAELDRIAVACPDAGERYEVWSPAGLSLFNVAGAEAAVEAMVECAARCPPTGGGHGRAVVVQAFVPGRAWAVAGSRAEAPGGGLCASVEAGWGVLPERRDGGLGGGRSLVERARPRVVHRVPAVQTRMLVPAGAGLRVADVPARKSAAAALDEGRTVQVAGLVVAAERFLGQPVSLELTFSLNDSLIRQCHLS